MRRRETRLRRLVADFEALNEQMRQYIARDRQTGQSGWTPTPEQQERAEKTAIEFLQAAENRHYTVAYEMYTQGTKALMSRAEYQSLVEGTISDLGSLPTRTGMRVTWYNDPPNAAAPGVYAAFDINCEHPKLQACSQGLILHEQSDGQFLVMRQERTLVK